MNFFVNSNQIRENKIYINNSDVNHIKNVLRKKPGDVINIVSEGNEYISQIISLTSECIECEVIDKKKENVKSSKTKANKSTTKKLTK